MTFPIVILLVLALIWLVISVNGKEFAGSGFWFQATVIAAILLTFGVLRG